MSLVSATLLYELAYIQTNIEKYTSPHCEIHLYTKYLVSPVLNKKGTFNILYFAIAESEFQGEG